MFNSKCKICRRLGVSVCGRAKCALRKRSFPPGQKRKRRRGGFSEYGRELKEKQKLKALYNLRETQFKRAVKEVLASLSQAKEDPSELLVQKLESRLDNVIFRLGLASSRRQARQLVSHSHFIINERAVNIPSYQLKKGDMIQLKPNKAKKSFFQNVLPLVKKQKPPSWLSWDFEKVQAKVAGRPSLEEVALPVDIPVIFEYYSR